jgi:hypothetical protein
MKSAYSVNRGYYQTAEGERKSMYVDASMMGVRENGGDGVGDNGDGDNGKTQRNGGTET